MDSPGFFLLSAFCDLFYAEVTGQENDSDLMWTTVEGLFAPENDLKSLAEHINFWSAIDLYIS